MTRLRLAERRTLLRLAVAAMLLVGSGVALGWRAGQIDVPPAAAIAKEKWSVTPPRREDPAKDLAVLASLHPWSGPAQAKRPENLRPPQWRLAGIIESGDEKYAIIAVGPAFKQRILYRRIGKSLPDGSILVQITADGAKTESHSAPASSSASRPTSPPSPASSSAPRGASPSEARTYRLFEKK